MLAMAGAIGGAAPGLAACSGLNQVTVSVTPGPVISGYDPFTFGDTVRSMTLTVRNLANPQCDVGISFVRSAGTPARMANGGSTLPYDITRSGGGSTLITQTGYTGIGTPPAANRIDFLNIPGNSSASANIELRVPQGQVVPSGPYADAITITTFRLQNGSNQPNAQGPTFPFTPQATVIAKCTMPPPSSSSLNFSSAISNGQPNEAMKQTVSFSNVQCTAPTKLRLTGAALQPTPAIGPRSGFDNFINFRAQGSFGSATSTLTTTQTSQSVDSSQKNVASGATTSGQINVDINLVNGQPIIAGSYSGTLTVSIDPSF